MLSNIPKGQHFISQMHAERFTDSSGRFYVFNKAADKVLHLTPAKAFKENHLYTIETAQGVKDTTLEARFSALETQVSPIMNKIVTAARMGKTPSLSPTERETWDLFFYMQWKRVPDVLRKVPSLRDGEAQLDAIFARLRAQHPTRSSELDALDTPEERRRLLQGGKVQAVGTIRREALAVLRGRGLAIALIEPPGEPLAIGSSPIVRKEGDLRNEHSEASDLVRRSGGLRLHRTFRNTNGNQQAAAGSEAESSRSSSKHQLRSAMQVSHRRACRIHQVLQGPLIEQAC